MDSQFPSNLSTIYQLSADIVESRARIAVLRWGEQESGLKNQRMRHYRMENLRKRIDRMTLIRHCELMKHYSNVKCNCPVPLPPLPPIKSLSSPFATPDGNKGKTRLIEKEW